MESKVQSRIQKCSPMIPILGRIKTISRIENYFFKVTRTICVWHVKDIWVIKSNMQYLLGLIYFNYFSPSSHLTLVFLSCRPFVVNTTFSRGLEVSGIGDRRNFKTCWKCCINNERPTGKKHTSVRWDDGEK